MPLDSRTLRNDHFPLWAEEPPVPSEGTLVTGSQFHEEQWIMAAGMLARGSSFLHVSRAMGCGRTTLWRAYYGSKDFRHRVWWERQALNREAELRLSSLRMLVAEQIERMVSSGDPSTIRWLADRLGLFEGLGSTRETARSAPRDIPDARRQPPGPQPLDPRPPRPDDLPSVTIPERDDDIPGALRERTPPDPRAVSATLARPETQGPKGVRPGTVNPGAPHPGLAAEPQGRRGAAAFRRPEEHAGGMGGMEHRPDAVPRRSTSAGWDHPGNAVARP